MSEQKQITRPGEIDLSELPEANREVLENIAGMRGMTVAETVAALIEEETDRIIRSVSPDPDADIRHKNPVRVPDQPEKGKEAA